MEWMKLCVNSTEKFFDRYANKEAEISVVCVAAVDLCLQHNQVVGSGI